MNIKAVVFDLDGTLVDSRLNFDLIREEIGMPKGLPILEYLETLDDPRAKERAFQIVEKHESKGAAEATAIYDANEFLQILSSRNIPKGILTRNSLQITRTTLDKFAWEFNLIISRDCAPPKPNPDGLLEIAKAFQIPLENILYIGDHEFDLKTARNAGAIAGLVINDRNKHLKKGADLAITSFLELLPYIND